MTKKSDGRANNGGHSTAGMAGRPSKNEGRVLKPLRYLPDTVETIESEAKRLGISQAAVVDDWARIAKLKLRANSQSPDIFDAIRYAL